MNLERWTERRKVFLAVVMTALLLAVPGFPLFEGDGGGGDMGGGGSCSAPSGYIPIANAGELQSIADQPNASYYLCDNIDLAGLSWTPIANFSGTLEGNNFAVSNLSLNSTGTNNIGLFASVIGAAQIQNLQLQNFNIAGANYVGALAGRLDGTAITASNISVSGLVSCDDDCGMLAGYAANTAISNSTAAADLAGLNRVGGLVGSALHSSILNSTVSTGSGVVVGQNWVGGVLGWGSGTNLYRAVFSGSINCPTGVSGAGIGGLVGLSASDGVSYPASIVESAADGILNCPDASKVGGLAGILQSGTPLAQSVVLNTMTDITLTGAGYVGGLIGYLDSYSSVSKSYAARNGASCSVATSGEAVGGQEETTLIDSIYARYDAGNGGVYCREFCAGINSGVCKSSSEMQSIDTFPDWDISYASETGTTSIWKIAPGYFPLLTFMVTGSSFPPTQTPTTSPTPSPAPTETATRTPTASPTVSPTPSANPTESPTISPMPSETPTGAPTESPTLSPTPTDTSPATPTASPTAAPTESPTLSPTPSDTPTAAPTESPAPTLSPSPEPTSDSLDTTPPQITLFRARAMSSTMLRISWRTSEPTFSRVTVKSREMAPKVRVRSTETKFGETIRARVKKSRRYDITVRVEDASGNQNTAVMKIPGK